MRLHSPPEGVQVHDNHAGDPLVQEPSTQSVSLEAERQSQALRGQSQPNPTCIGGPRRPTWLGGYRRTPLGRLEGEHPISSHSRT
jgi:hypothetical protein